MKTFMVRYTGDFGTTYHTELVNADTFTDAYVKMYIKLSKNEVITDLFEII